MALHSRARHKATTEMLFAAWFFGGATVYLLKAQFIESALIYAAGIAFVLLGMVLSRPH